MKKIINILIHEAPYKDPIINELKATNDIVLKNVNLYKNPTTHDEWNLDKKEYNDNIHRIKIPIIGDLHIGVIKILKSFKPDLVIVSGYYPIINYVVILFCNVHKIKYIYGIDTVEKSKHWMSNIINRFAIEHSIAVFNTGKKSNMFVSKISRHEINKINGFYCLDVKKERSVYENEKKKRNTFRKQLNITEDDFVFLFVGKLIKSRRIVDFFQFNINKLNKNIVILIIGDGPESEKLDSIIANTFYKIIHINKVQYSELLKYYAISDAYFHPGKEPYSLALVQAIMCELPIVSSYDVGAVHDFLENKKNGFIVPNNDIELYYKYINEIGKHCYSNVELEKKFKLLKNAYNITVITNQIKKCVIEVKNEENNSNI